MTPGTNLPCAGWLGCGVKANAPAELSKGDRARYLIVSRSVEIAAREGLAGLSIGRLANVTGMTKSGLFAHFRSKRKLELATINRARDIFYARVLWPAEETDEGIKRVWRLCDLWLEHVQKNVFSGSYFFIGALFGSAGDSDLYAEVVQVIKRWLNTLKKAVQAAQKTEEIEPDLSAIHIARELNGILVGAHFNHLVGDWWWAWSEEARRSILAALKRVATDKVPVGALESLESFLDYLKPKRQ